MSRPDEPEMFIEHVIEEGRRALFAMRSEWLLKHFHDLPPVRVEVPKGICLTKHEWSCCGCAEHPGGHPMGENHEAWMVHLDAHVSTTS